VLIVFTVKDANQLFGGCEGRQLLETLVGRQEVQREYFVAGNWGTVQGSRYNIGTISPLLTSTSKVWKYLKEREIQPVVKQEEILSLLFTAKKKGTAIPFFSPWGPRYKKNSPIINDEDLEIKTLQEIRSLFAGIKSKGYEIDFVLMPADLYGTTINNLSSLFVRQYFNSLRERAVSNLGDVCTLCVKPWSAFKREREVKYITLREKIEAEFSTFISDAQFEKAFETAKVFNPANAYGSAWNYCVERVIEALLIEEIYSPIKLSLVRKEKDDLDGPLKRMYMIKNKAPWLGGD